MQFHAGQAFLVPLYLLVLAFGLDRQLVALHVQLSPHHLGVNQLLLLSLIHFIQFFEFVLDVLLVRAQLRQLLVQACVCLRALLQLCGEVGVLLLKKIKLNLQLLSVSSLMRLWLSGLRWRPPASFLLQYRDLGLVLCLHLDQPFLEPLDLVLSFACQLLRLVLCVFFELGVDVFQLRDASSCLVELILKHGLLAVLPLTCLFLELKLFLLKIRELGFILGHFPLELFQPFLGFLAFLLGLCL